MTTPEAKRAAEPTREERLGMSEDAQIIYALSQQVADKDKVIESLRAELIDEREALTDYREANIALTQDRDRLQAQLDEWRFHEAAWGTNPHDVRKHIRELETRATQAEKARDELVGVAQGLAEIVTFYCGKSGREALARYTTLLAALNAATREGEK